MKRLCAAAACRSFWEELARLDLYSEIETEIGRTVHPPGIGIEVYLAAIDLLAEIGGNANAVYALCQLVRNVAFCCDLNNQNTFPVQPDVTVETGS